MIAALRGTYIEAVFYTGITENYPEWFADELYECTFTDDSRYTFWVPESMRQPDYYEKQLVEDFSVFLRKPNGEIGLTDYDAVDELFTIFKTDKFNNTALLALDENVVKYVECHGGHVVSGYPEWFYEYFTEAVNNPTNEETIFIDNDNGDITITEHCAVLQNQFGEVMIMDWERFNQHYDISPGVGMW